MWGRVSLLFYGCSLSIGFPPADNTVGGLFWAGPLHNGLAYVLLTKPKKLQNKRLK